MTKATPQERLVAARAVMAAYHSAESLAECLDHWDLFVPYPLAPIQDEELIPEYLWSRYTQLRTHAFEWLTEQRFLALETRIEALESASYLGDHR